MKKRVITTTKLAELTDYDIKTIKATWDRKKNHKDKTYQLTKVKDYRKFKVTFISEDEVEIYEEIFKDLEKINRGKIDIEEVLKTYTTGMVQAAEDMKTDLTDLTYQLQKIKEEIREKTKTNASDFEYIISDAIEKIIEPLNSCVEKVETKATLIAGYVQSTEETMSKKIQENVEKSITPLKLKIEKTSKLAEKINSLKEKIENLQKVNNFRISQMQQQTFVSVLINIIGFIVIAVLISRQ